MKSKPSIEDKIKEYFLENYKEAKEHFDNKGSFVSWAYDWTVEDISADVVRYIKENKDRWLNESGK